MRTAEFEPGILASEWPQTHTLDRRATGIGTIWFRDINYSVGLAINLVLSLEEIVNAPKAWPLTSRVTLHFNPYRTNVENRVSS